MKDFYLYITNQLNPASLIAFILLDLFWSFFEGAVDLSGIGVLLTPIFSIITFAICFPCVILIQRYASYDSWSAALAKGLTLGILAALPLSFIGLGTAVIWGGLRVFYGVDEEVILLGKLTYAWREIEKSLRNAAPYEVRSKTIDEVIDYYYESGRLSLAQRDRLHRLRKLRNVHTHEMSTDHLATLVDDVTAMQNGPQMGFLRR
jgi:hypothetical protein